jgi:hypothetical protein
MKHLRSFFMGGCLLCFGAACDDVTPLSVELVFPVSNSGDPFFNVETLVFGADDGTTEVQQSFPADDKKLKLPVIPYGDGWVLSLAGRFGDTPVSFGKTVPLSLTSGEEVNAKIFFGQVNAFHVPPGQPLENPQPLLMAGFPPFSVSTCSMQDGGFGFVGGQPVEEFTASQLSFSQSDIIEPRVGAVCAPSPDGSLLIGGALDVLGHEISSEIAPLQLEEPSEQRTINSSLARIGHQANTFTTTQSITLPDGTQVDEGTTLILISGGMNNGQIFGEVGLIIAAPGQDLRVYEPANLDQKIKLISPRVAHSATLVQIDGKAEILLAGGLGKNLIPLKTTELLDLSTFTTTLGPDLNEPRSGHVAVLVPNGDVLFFGGQTQNKESSARIDRFSPKFPVMGVEPSMLFTRRGHSATLLESGLILIAGGIGQRTGSLDDEQLLASGELFNPEDATGSGPIFTRSLNAPRAGHAAVFMPNGLILLVGGTQESTQSAELYTPVPEE